MLILAVVAAACAPVLPRAEPPTLVQRPVGPVLGAGPGVAAVRGPLPFPFEQNVGQASPSIAYLLRAGDHHVGFRERGVSIRLHAVESRATDDTLPGRDRPGTGTVRRSWNVEQELVGARAGSHPVGTVPTETAVSWLPWIHIS